MRLAVSLVSDLGPIWVTKTLMYFSSMYFLFRTVVLYLILIIISYFHNQIVYRPSLIVWSRMRDYCVMGINVYVLGCFLMTLC
jgi:hypothetical protein